MHGSATTHMPLVEISVSHTPTHSQWHQKYAVCSTAKLATHLRFMGTTHIQTYTHTRAHTHTYTNTHTLTVAPEVRGVQHCEAGHPIELGMCKGGAHHLRKLCHQARGREGVAHADEDGEPQQRVPCRSVLQAVFPAEGACGG